MIITISGRAGSGKSTIAKILAKKLNLKHYSIGDLQRQIAKEKGISLIELSKLEEKDDSIDRELDRKQVDLGKKEDNFIIDGRLSAFFIPNAKLKIFLDADEEVRAERILNDQRIEEEGDSAEDVIRQINAREKSENKRYMAYYGFNCYDKSRYDFVINTSKLTPNEIADDIIKIIKKVTS